MEKEKGREGGREEKQPVRRKYAKIASVSKTQAIPNENSCEQTKQTRRTDKKV
jgi:hypothetical protein